MNKNKNNLCEVSLLESRCDFLKFGCPVFPSSIGRGWGQENHSWDVTRVGCVSSWSKWLCRYHDPQLGLMVSSLYLEWFVVYY